MNQLEMISPGRTSTAAAYCRGVVSLDRSPASFDHPEHGLTRSQAGQPALGCYASIHVHGGHGHCVLDYRKFGFSKCIDAFPETYHGFGSSRRRGLFAFEHGSSRAEITCAQSPLNGFSERDECHLKFPLRASSNALRITQKQGRGRGHFIQEYGRSGRGGADD